MAGVAVVHMCGDASQHVPDVISPVLVGEAGGERQRELDFGCCGSSGRPGGGPGLVSVPSGGGVSVSSAGSSLVLTGCGRANLNDGEPTAISLARVTARSSPLSSTMRSSPVETASKIASFRSCSPPAEGAVEGCSRTGLVVRRGAGRSRHRGGRRGVPVNGRRRPRRLCLLR